MIVTYLVRKVLNNTLDSSSANGILVSAIKIVALESLITIDVALTLILAVNLTSSPENVPDNLVAAKELGRMFSFWGLPIAWLMETEAEKRGLFI